MTGIELLEEILKEVREIKTQNALMDANVKVIANRINILISGKGIQQTTSITIKPAEVATVMVRTPEIKVSAPEEVKIAVPQQLQRPEAVPGKVKLVYKKVYGYLKNVQQVPIDEAVVLIYNNKNEACGSAVTDGKGYWSTMLTPGRYSMECKKANFPSANKNFEFIDGVPEYEVK